MASSSALWRSNSARAPLTHIASFPLLAPVGPPLTGASSSAMPLAAKRSCRRRTTVGEFVVKSNQVVPRRMPASKPSSARATASTSFGPGSEVKTTSLASATRRAESAQTHPAARCGAAASRRKSFTTSSWPAARTLSAMLAPMVPSPMNPTFMKFSSLQFASSYSGLKETQFCSIRADAAQPSITPQGSLRQRPVDCNVGYGAE